MSEYKWCQHMESTHAKAIYYPGMTEPVNFCPVCGAKKPVTKTEVERLAEKFREYLPYTGSDFNMEGLAKIAIEFCGNNKSKLHQSYDDFYAVNKRYPTSAEFIGLVSENMD